MSTVSVRTAVTGDATACAALYAPYVTDTAVSFETTPPTPVEMAARIAAAAQHAWLVAEVDQRVVGYAYAGAFAPRPAYRWACETSVYVEAGRRRTGAGRALYAELLGRLAGRGYRRALAGMTLPNAASEGLHRAIGFVPVGVYRAVGFKLGAWHDVGWVQKSIAGVEEPPRDLR